MQKKCVNSEQTTTLELPFNYIYIEQILKHSKNPFHVHQHIGYVSAPSRFSPTWVNNDFTPGRRDGVFKLWETKGMQCIRNPYKTSKLLSFEQI